MSNKLHELLAVEQERKNKANQALGEAKKTFTKNDPYFDGMVKHYVSLEENSDEIPDETKEMVTTVKKKLEDAMEFIIAGIDANVSKEETNSADVAKAELTIGNKKFGTFSATSLLALESNINRLKDLYNAIPTLDQTRKWEFDNKTNVYRTPEEVKFRTVKRPKVIVKYEATKEHPAQTELLNLDFQVGKYETVYTSGKVTSSQKSDMIARIDELLEAVKVARSKANSAEVKNTKVGKDIFEFIHKGILK